MNWFARMTDRLGAYSDRWWYLPAVSTLAGIDLFVAFIPTEAFLVSSILLRPERWIRIFVWISLGSAVGALALAGLIKGYGEPMIQSIFGEALMKSEAWESAAKFIHRYGWLALFFFAIGPLPQQPAVAFCALTNMSVTSIALAVLAGRGLKYGLFAWASAHGKEWITQAVKLEDKKAIEESEIIQRHVRPSSKKSESPES